MFSSVFNRLGLTISSKSGVATLSANFFGKTLGASLGNRIGSYVDDGQASSVLSDLSAPGPQQKWSQRRMTYPRRDEDGLFRDVSRWRTDQMVRLGEALALLDPIKWDWGFFGSKSSPDWLRHVLSLWLGHERKNQPIDMLLALVRDGGLGAEAALDVVFSRDASVYSATTSMDRFDGVEQWLRDAAAEIGAAAGKANAAVRGELVAAVGRFGLHPLYYPLLLDLATGSAKGPRKAANQALTGADPDTLEQALEARFAKDAPGKRALLVETIAGTLGDRAQPLLSRLREGETSAPVLSAMDRFAGAVTATAPVKELGAYQTDGVNGFVALDGEWVAAPAHPALPPRSAVAQEALDLVPAIIEGYNEKLAEQKKAAKGMNFHWTRHLKPVPMAAVSQLREAAEMNYPVPKNSGQFHWLNGHVDRHPNIDSFFDHPGLDLRHLVRLAMVTGSRSFMQIFGQWSGPAAMAIQRRLAQGADVRQVYDLWLENGGEPFLMTYLASGYYGYDEGVLGDRSWPLLLEQITLLDEALGLVPQSGNRQLSTYRGLRALEIFPKVPERYRGRLMLLANETSWQVRQKARDLLAAAEGIEDSIALQLEDGKQEVRAGAADWLVARNATGHVGAIRQRLKKEKSDKARAAMITALDRLGDDTSDFFDRKAMLKEAEKGLAKPMPKGLEWFPFDALPALQWANGEAVDPLLPRYWIVLATRLKDPGGNALIDLWLDRLAPGDAHKLGWMVLTGWIAEDTRTPTEEEANAHALAHIDATLANNKAMAKRWPQSADYFVTDYDTLFAQLKRARANTYLGTATDSKGMLALASRVTGSDAAPRIRSFLKDHGARTSQARALLDVLASIGTPAALQVLLSTADRLKQKSVQAHARKLIEDVAEQRGWTSAELADRTVPTGGLDDDGVLELDCGQDRLYTARLDEEDKLVLLNAAGKEVKALPSARVEDEAPVVAASKKALSAAKKEVKQVVTAQTERLREAMCLERAWTAEDWRLYVSMHPILGRLAARLVWLGVDADGQVQASFRPLGDGTFTDAADGDVDPAAFATVKLAHSTLLSAQDAEAWKTHLADYAVTPLFEQLGRPLPEITEDMRKRRSVTDREGYMIESFRLRGIATKLGYQRGEAIDGGCFTSYTRSMREAGLVAEIEFTGSYLPEQNIPAALVSLSFRKLMSNGRAGNLVDLGAVPDVLLAESWRDLHEIAEKGTGFDPDWQKKAAL